LLGAQLWPRNAYDRHFLPSFLDAKIMISIMITENYLRCPYYPHQVLKCVLLAQTAYPVIGKPGKALAACLEIRPKLSTISFKVTGLGFA